MSDEEKAPEDPQEIRRLTRKELAKEMRRAHYLKMKERTAPARKAAYEKQKAAFKVRRDALKAKEKEAKAEARRDAVAERDAALIATLMPAEKVKPRLKLVKPLD